MPNHLRPAAADEETIAQAAARTGINRRTLAHAVKTGRLPARKLPGRTGRWLVWPHDVNRFAQEFYGAAVS